MNFAIQEARTILEESIDHIDRKDELVKHFVKFLLQRELIGVWIF